MAHSGPKAQDISSFKFGRLTAIRPIHTGKHARWEFQCDCGTTKTILKGHVTSGKTKSCGCLSRDVTTKRNSTHGMTHTKCFTTWQRIKNRCDNPNNSDYYLYGGRGIKYCAEWEVFTNFYKDMGEPPIGSSIDRIDVNGDYEPSNCRWATAKEQANNKRNNVFLQYQGKSQTVAQWSMELGIKSATIYERLKKNWSIEKVLCTKLYPRP